MSIDSIQYPRFAAYIVYNLKMTNTTVNAEIINNKNKNSVHCEFCNSLILKEQCGVFHAIEFDLPMMHLKHSKDGSDINSETYSQFWLVDDMFTFENIGFSNTVGNKKYLICADCDMGPLGFHDIDNKNCYIALKRVKNGPSDVQRH